jgi:hypothetical protein
MLQGEVTIDLSLVPFGLHAETEQLLDVHEVTKGKSCACICPSCRAPLVARQGEVREWHFAHFTRNAATRAEQPCDFSFYVSVRMMSRQLVDGELSMSLPAYYGTIERMSGHLRQQAPSSFLVTSAKRITLKDVCFDTSVDGIPVDILGAVEEYKFAVYLTHPRRPVPEALRQVSDGKCGIVAISLEETRSIFR